MIIFRLFAFELGKYNFGRPRRMKFYTCTHYTCWRFWLSIPRSAPVREFNEHDDVRITRGNNADRAGWVLSYDESTGEVEVEVSDGMYGTSIVLVHRTMIEKAQP